jgi:hypothetical protein
VSPSPSLSSLRIVTAVLLLALAGCKPTTDDDADTCRPEDAQQPCEKQQGVCAGSTRTCVDRQYEPVCTSASYGQAYEPLELSCNGLDNDCDGTVDVGHLSPPLDPTTFELLTFELGFGALSTRSTPEGVTVVYLVLTPDFAAVGEPVDAGRSWPAGTTFSATKLPRGGALVRVHDPAEPGVLRFENTGTGARLAGPPLPLPVEGSLASLAPLSDGQRIVAAWLGADGDIHASVLDESGAVVTGPAVLPMRAQGETFEFSHLVLVSWDEGFAVSVAGSGAYASQLQVWARRFDSTLTPVGERETYPVAVPEYPRTSSPYLVGLSALHAEGGPLTLVWTTLAMGYTGHQYWYLEAVQPFTQTPSPRRLGTELLEYGDTAFGGLTMTTGPSGEPLVAYLGVTSSEEQPRRADMALRLGPPRGDWEQYPLEKGVPHVPLQQYFLASIPGHPRVVGAVYPTDSGWGVTTLCLP